MLYQTIKMEEWLCQMAHKGLLLVSVQGNQYIFKQTSPQHYSYFVMSPETGTYSDAWVFYEFEQQTGKRIPCAGFSFFSPSHILQFQSDISDSKAPLISYYYQHRRHNRTVQNSVSLQCLTIIYI